MTSLAISSRCSVYFFFFFFFFIWGGEDNGPASQRDLQLCEWIGRPRFVPRRPPFPPVRWHACTHSYDKQEKKEQRSEKIGLLLLTSYFRDGKTPRHQCWPWRRIETVFVAFLGGNACFCVRTERSLPYFPTVVHANQRSKLIGEEKKNQTAVCHVPSHGSFLPTRFLLPPCPAVASFHVCNFIPGPADISGKSAAHTPPASPDRSR
jgi:hypothetical protein